MSQESAFLTCTRWQYCSRRTACLARRPVTTRALSVTAALRLLELGLRRGRERSGRTESFAYLRRHPFESSAGACNRTSSRRRQRRAPSGLSQRRKRLRQAAAACARSADGSGGGSGALRGWPDGGVQRTCRRCSAVAGVRCACRHCGVGPVASSGGRLDALLKRK